MAANLPSRKASGEKEIKMGTFQPPSPALLPALHNTQKIFNSLRYNNLYTIMVTSEKDFNTNQVFRALKRNIFTVNPFTPGS